MNGVLLVIKPPGMTSFDVVSWLRGIFGVKKIGHAGTLDPAAAGLLPVCIGKATGTIDWFSEFDKAYRAEMVLGITTNTQDGEGEVLSKKPVRLEMDRLLTVLDAFRGEYEQLPPMFSAVKVNGRRLYELARQGVELERKSRKVFIADLTLLSVDADRDYPVVRFDVTCSKGTYIRTLCADMGERLGCGAYMSFLARTRVGPFSVENAHTLEEIQKSRNAGTLSSLMLPTDSVFIDYPAISLAGDDLKRFMNGAWVKPGLDQGQAEIFRVYEKPDRFIGLGKMGDVNGRTMLRARKLFVGEQV